LQSSNPAASFTVFAPTRQTVCLNHPIANAVYNSPSSPLRYKKGSPDSSVFGGVFCREDQTTCQRNKTVQDQLT
jgi:hypothetical protein